MGFLTIYRYQDEIRQALLNYRGWELAALAREAGLSRATVYRLRTDLHANPRLDTIQKLGLALGMGYSNTLNFEAA